MYWIPDILFVFYTYNFGKDEIEPAYAGRFEDDRPLGGVKP